MLLWTDSFQPDVLPAPRWYQIINPVWLASDQERNPNWSWWQTFKRNWFANFKSVVIGVAHHKRQWVNTMHGENFPPSGFGMGYVLADNCVIARPWICYRGKRIEFGAGWKSHGGFGINIRPANTPNAGPLP